MTGERAWAGAGQGGAAREVIGVLILEMAMASLAAADKRVVST